MNIPAVFVLQIAYSLFMAMKTLIYIEKVRVPLLKDFGSFYVRVLQLVIVFYSI